MNNVKENAQKRAIDALDILVKRYPCTEDAIHNELYQKQIQDAQDRIINTLGVMVMDEITLDMSSFPELRKRYSEQELKAVLIKMCAKQNLEINNVNIHSLAADLESDLSKMFA